MNGYEFPDHDHDHDHGSVVLPLECPHTCSLLPGAFCPHRLPPCQLKVQVLKPLLPCEKDGVGMFGLFLTRNSDGEFAVGHYARENHIFLYINKHLSCFSRGRPRGAVKGSFHFPGRKAPPLSAWVLEGNIKQHISTQTVI